MASSDNSNYLVGVWVSDKETTIEFNRERASWTEDQLKVFSNMLGKLKVSFTENNIEWSYEDTSGRSEYEIIEKTESSITIRTAQTIENVTYHKEGDLVYIEPAQTKSLLREYFKSVK